MPRSVTPSSEKSFGLVFAVVFALVAIWPFATRGQQPHWWAAGIAVVLVVIAFLAPRLLSPFNRAWFRLGLALHHVVNPVLMALLYYGAFVPLGFVFKARSKDLLRLERQPEAESYWILRTPPGPGPETMIKQF